MTSPLRVWEETWTYEPLTKDNAPRVATGLRHYIRQLTMTEEHDPQAAGRLRLIAQAPAMARTLMQLAGMGTDPYCNGCGDTSKRGHARDCSLMQLLFAAGCGDLKQADRSPCLALVPPPDR